MRPELPPFIQRITQRRTRPAVPPSPAEVAHGPDELYAEVRANYDQPGWLESPRGVWVCYQLDWYESRRGGCQ